LLGTVALELSGKPKTRHKGSIIGMYVLPAARGKGAGRALMAAALEHCRIRPGLAVVNLTVTEGNAPAIALYRSFGFREFGLEPKAIRGASGYRSKVHMWLDLE
jgi:ribosomal protein S18 acetylase RimI-like enzyme